ncbi:unnamed protein product [Ectocarpus sp. 13 AM-2016]
MAAPGVFASLVSAKPERDTTVELLEVSGCTCSVRSDPRFSAWMKIPSTLGVVWTLLFISEVCKAVEAGRTCFGIELDSFVCMCCCRCYDGDSCCPRSLLLDRSLALDHSDVRAFGNSGTINTASDRTTPDSQHALSTFGS